jgi:hypothetical protein
MPSYESCTTETHTCESFSTLRYCAKGAARSRLADSGHGNWASATRGFRSWFGNFKRIQTLCTENSDGRAIQASRNSFAPERTHRC